MENSQIKTHSTTEETYLLAQIDSITFAVPASQVLHISRLPKIKTIPNAAPSISGAISFRDTVISVIDLRHFLGYETMADQANELAKVLKKRKEEHVEWLNELQRCVKQGEEFTLEKDPKKCKFGEWFYNFKTENKALQMLLARFEAPHNAIHGIANKAFDLIDQDRLNDATALIEKTKNTDLKTIITLFDEFEKAYTELNRSLVIVLWSGSQTIGYCVDGVSSVMRLKPLTQEEGLDENVSLALKEYGEHVFIHDGKIIYELQPERISEVVTGVY